jgi:hypothetical protein
MSDGNKPLGSAILSLLVAADQRCPAIIGQAHLLYYARFGETLGRAQHQPAKNVRAFTPVFAGDAVSALMSSRAVVSENAEKSFAQLKRDAADLFKAIADVEAAMKETNEN